MPLPPRFVDQPDALATAVVLRSSAPLRERGSQCKRAERDNRALYFANAANPASIALHRAFGFVEISRDFTFPGVTFVGGTGILFEASLTRG